MKRFLSLLVAIVMVISMVPAAFAAGEVGGTPDVGLWDVEEISNINLTANLAEGDDNGNYYLWTVSEDGKMIVSSSAAEGYAYNIVMTKGETVVSGTALELDVVAGDEVLIQVVATGAGYPAGSVTVTGAYYVEPEPPVEPETGVVINAQPVDFGYVVGGTATFTVDASNVAKYVWQFRKTETADWANASSFTGWKTATLSLTVPNETYTGWQFRCRLDDADGNQTYTDVVSLFPKVANITITQYSENKPVVEGKVATYVVIATGAVRYQWMSSNDGGNKWTTIGANDTNGATTNRLNIKAWNSGAGALYRCKMWDADGAFTYSDNFTMIVAENPLVGEPTPSEVWAVKGTNASMTFNVSGATIAKYQWQTSRNGTTWGNTTLPTYNQATFTLAAYGSRDGVYFRCIAIAEDGNKIISDPIQLKIEVPPFEIVLQPTNVATTVGTAGVFNVAVQGHEELEGDLTYVWFYQIPGKDTWTAVGSNYGGKTPTLSWPGQARFNGYRFRCQIKDAAGHYLYTDKVTLTVG